MPENIPVIEAIIWAISFMILSSAISAKIAISKYKSTHQYNRHNENTDLLLSTLQNLKEALLYSLNRESQTEFLKVIGKTQEDIKLHFNQHALNFNKISLQLQKLDDQSDYRLPKNVKPYPNMAVQLLKDFAMSPDLDKKAEHTKVAGLILEIENLIKEISHEVK